jgi:hypothetical protein
MYPPMCDRLDDFLARDLAAEVERAFEAHLLDCPACLAAVKQQERIDALLSEAVERLVPMPADLIPRTRTRLKAARRRRYLAYALSVSAAAALVWSLVRLAPWAPQSPVNRESQPQVQVAEKKEVPPADVRIAFKDDSKLLIVPEKTDSPNVTFVWVFPNQRMAAVADVRDSNPPSFERISK